MPYPDQSDFTSATTDSGWFYAPLPGDPSTPGLIQTEGFRLAFRVKSVLVQALVAAGGLDDRMGGTISSDAIVVNGTWDLPMLRGLSAVLGGLSGIQSIPQPMRTAAGYWADAAKSAAQTGQVTADAIGAAAFFIYYSMHQTLNPYDVQVPADAVLPTLGQALPQPAGFSSSGAAVDYISQAAANAVPQDTSQPAPDQSQPAPTTDQTSQAPAQQNVTDSTSGGTAPTPQQQPLAKTGGTSSPATTGGSSSRSNTGRWLVYGGIGLGVAALVTIVAVTLAEDKKPALQPLRKNPRRRRHKSKKQAT